MQAIMIDSHEPDMEPETDSCRICQGDNGALISPCRCSGGTKWVHRACLDQWRSQSRGQDAFTHCEVCRFEFVVDRARDDHVISRKCRYSMYVARDGLIALLVIQFIVALLGLLIRQADVDHRIRNLFPEWVSGHDKTTYYICGTILFLAILGVIALLAYCMGAFDEDGVLGVRPLPQRHDPGCICCCDSSDSCGGYPHHHSYGGRNDCDCDCGNCGGGRGGGGGDAAGGCLLVVVVLIVIAAIVGAVVLFFAGTLLFQRILQRHARILWLREEVKLFVVHDFGLGEPAAATATAVASAPLEIDLPVSTIPYPKSF